MKRMHIEKGVHGNKRERAKDNKKGIQQCAVATADLYNTSKYVHWMWYIWYLHCATPWYLVLIVVQNIILVFIFTSQIFIWDWDLNLGRKEGYSLRVSVVRGVQQDYNSQSHLNVTVYISPTSYAYLTDSCLTKT